MKALMVAALMLATPARAELWADQTCFYTVESSDGVFTFTRDDGSDPRHCQIEAWPLNTPVAQMACDDGSKPQMSVLDKETIIFDGIALHVPRDDNGICD